ncbi:MAG TPA: 50S ribosomal protein L32 [Desulfobacteraceae bacterium]|uniref:LSU ribosomal protein L32p @ LSU ribosomal protein L32p, zinc-dependent n=1 Tax=hydrothermal vent metagenome TaxID=652676 RepID=A0A3B0UTQ0_9ZZZZ|nr:50S ribosomal protein L32 [Deltaproteobacteria bacterium]HDK43045.1 50S ribosomal protein L32 [Desulfobacteraceae bacterium]
MALPKRRHSYSRTRKRRAHDFLTPPQVAKCPECGEPKMPHRLCGGCGMYKNRTVIHLEEEIS